LCDFGFDLGAEFAHFAARAGELGLRMLDELRVGEIGFAEVKSGDDAFYGEELQRAKAFFLTFMPRVFAK